ncbi:MetQ/NlpA family ABC transporter substrate-binding protein [Corticimicrobacter populi]|uniref:Iron ABC transporter substrate-binding protein n=1 Tax=Corticimicrobacter populi TaxID=2175229 RepID=A0A2V1K0L8_9BURK|nr:iron ABC transporter substrate-binding protein [Corticimicrobacter populi]
MSFFRGTRMALAAVAWMGLAVSAGTQAAERPLRVGVIPVVANAATELAVAKAREEGLEVELIELNDWVMPNRAVADGSIDVNFFQHQPFLEQFNRSQGSELMPIAYGYSTTMGIYSKKLGKGDPIPPQATIAVPGDPVNTARALLLLQSAGLLKLRPGATHEATLADIVENPLALEIVQIDGAHSTRSFDDVTASVTYASFAKLAGIDERDALFYDNTDPDNVRRYAIRWVTLPERADDPRILRFIEIYQQTPEVREKLQQLYGELISFPW